MATKSKKLAKPNQKKRGQDSKLRAQPSTKRFLNSNTSLKLGSHLVSLPTFRSPLVGAEEIFFETEVDHAFFLRCCELYRVLDLLERTTDSLIETYSKYRHREQFTETLSFRYFDSEEALVAKFDPKLAATMFFLFNYIHEMKIYLTYTDQLPLSVKNEIENAMGTLRAGWNELQKGTEEKFGWVFKRMESTI